MLPQEDQNLVNQVYDDFAKYYLAEAKRPGSDWTVETKVVGLPLGMVNGRAKNQLKTLKEILEKNWEAITMDLRMWKEDVSRCPVRDYMEALHLLYTLEQEGQGRITLLKLIRDEVQAEAGRDDRFRETSPI